MARAPTGLRVRERRRAMGLTQAGLAREIGVSATYLNLIENGKRPIGGKLLMRLARALDSSLEALDGAADRRLIDALGEIVADPAIRAATPPPAPETAAPFVGRHPDWAAALVALHRAYVDRDRLASALADRLNQDPFLSDAVHKMLSNVAAIRSASEILETVEDIAPDQAARFQRVISEESARLAEVSRSMAAFFEQADAEAVSVTPAEEVDDFIAERRNFFPRLEEAVSELRFVAQLADGRMKSGLIDHLQARYGVHVSQAPASRTASGSDDEGTGEGAHWGEAARFDAERRELHLPEDAAEPTRRFLLAREVALLAAGAAIDAEIEGAASLRSAAAKSRARRALASYCAAAILAPYDAYLEAAEQTRYDVMALSRRFALSYEQAAHRLATLRKPGAEGVPFAFMRSDPSGFVTKRLALPTLPLPRHGGACPLWAIYQAFHAPETTARQLVEFPNGERFLFVARAVAKEGPGFDRPRRLMSIMLACDAVHADRLVYSDGLAISQRAAPTPVGLSCRLCVRTDCSSRQEDILVGG